MEEINKLTEEIKRHNKEKERQEKIKNIILFLIFLALILRFVIPVPCPCPPPATYDVEKWVYDEDGHPLVGAVVKLAYDSDGEEIYATAITNHHGKAVFHHVPYGTYYLNVSYCYNGEWYYGEEDWEEIVVDADVSIENYLPSLHIGELGGGYVCFDMMNNTLHIVGNVSDIWLTLGLWMNHIIEHMLVKNDLPVVVRFTVFKLIFGEIPFRFENHKWVIGGIK